MFPQNEWRSIGLALACSVIASIVVLELTLWNGAQIDARADAALASELPRVDALPNHIPPSFDSFIEILDRPLFFPDRKLPPRPVAAAPVEVPREPLGLVLEGVAIADNSRVALLRSQASNALVQLAQGMTHNGWTLDSVLTDKTIFNRDDETVELLLETDLGARRRH